MNDYPFIKQIATNRNSW